MDSASSSLLYHQQQFTECRAKKHKEILNSSIKSPDEHSYLTTQEIFQITFPETIDMKKESVEDEKVEWKRKQEDYKKRLKENRIEPLKLRVYDFTKQSENQKRLKSNNFEFITENITQESSYIKEDINILYSTLGRPILPIISKETSINIQSQVQEAGNVQGRSQSATESEQIKKRLSVF
jgi:rubrerythrin